MHACSWFAFYFSAEITFWSTLFYFVSPASFVLDDTLRAQQLFILADRFEFHVVVGRIKSLLVDKRQIYFFFNAYRIFFHWYILRKYVAHSVFTGDDWEKRGTTLYNCIHSIKWYKKKEFFRLHNHNCQLTISTNVYNLFGTQNKCNAANQNEQKMRKL